MIIHEVYIHDVQGILFVAPGFQILEYQLVSYRVDGLYTIPPLLPPGDCVCVCVRACVHVCVKQYIASVQKNGLAETGVEFINQPMNHYNL